MDWKVCKSLPMQCLTKQKIPIKVRQLNVGKVQRSQFMTLGLEFPTMDLLLWQVFGTSDFRLCTLSKDNDKWCLCIERWINFLKFGLSRLRAKCEALRLCPTHESPVWLLTIAWSPRATSWEGFLSLTSDNHFRNATVQRAWYLQLLLHHNFTSTRFLPYPEILSDLLHSGRHTHTHTYSARCHNWAVCERSEWGDYRIWKTALCNNTYRQLIRNQHPLKWGDQIRGPDYFPRSQGSESPQEWSWTL